MDRRTALSLVGKQFSQVEGEFVSPTDRFRARVFSLDVMRQMLPHDVYLNVSRAMDGKADINPAYADTIATAMKEWAVSLGATHYCHWFQPLTGATAEKHDSFLDWSGGQEGVIERFDGKQLIQGEPDASSFPSGGLRSTYEARGYTGWDPASPAFIWLGGDGITLCIPSVFFSWTGDVLDTKIPLHRSDAQVDEAVKRLLKYTGTKADRIYSNVGWEQEYFVVDRALRTARPDLVLLGRTIFGAPPAKGQELEDHYFGTVKDRILSFMQDFENHALELGIPIKTRHNEVAPAQHEMAPYFERAILAVDHNIIAMELLRQLAVKHNLACLLHEKPFAGLNGSGKHVNWSLATDGGVNLFDPKSGDLQFLVMLTAVLTGVHRHADLLSASIASRGNEFRLGGHEAPPTIISVYLGDELEKLLDDIEGGRTPKASKGGESYKLGIPSIPDLPRDYTDRNRTSPLAFTGNKFEYRAAGSTVNCAVPVTVLNLLVAQALHEIIDEIEESGETGNKKAFAEAALPVLRKHLKASKPVRFPGNNYGEEWVQEATKRKLPNLASAPEALAAYSTAKAAKLFDGVLSPLELESRKQIALDAYAKTVHIEANLALELFRTQILPAIVRSQNELVRGIEAIGGLRGLVGRISKHCDKAIELADRLEVERDMAKSATNYREKVAPLIDQLRIYVDQLEELIDDKEWPLPKYRELLFLV